MEMLLWVFGACFLWFVLGCVVLALIDHDGQLFLWAQGCPIPFGYELTVAAWPIILWFWFRAKP